MFRLFIEINSIERMINTYRWSTLDYITACVTMFASNQPKPFTGISTFTQFLFEGFIFLRCRLIRLSLCSYAVCWKLKNRKLLVGNVQDWKQKAGENHSIACSIGWGKKTDWFGRLIACTSYSQFTKHKLSKKEEKKPTETKPNWLYMHYCNIQNAKHSTFNALCSL